MKGICVLASINIIQVINMELMYVEAIRQALYKALKMDSSVILFGEDIRQNLYGYTEGLVDEFGYDRIINIPLSEASVMGLVCGASMCGVKPVFDVTLPNFLYITMDQIANIAAKTHYMYNGEYTLPMTLFCSVMSGSGNAAQHSDRLHSILMNIPGIKIICPATPQDMYSMLVEAILDDNPVVCFADRKLFWNKGEVNFEEKKVIGKANVVITGKDLTIVTISSCLQMVLDIIPDIKKLNFSVELIDLRSVVPLDFNTVKESVNKTGRVIICDTANRSGSVASTISSLIVEELFYSLKAPIHVVACEDVPVPFSRNIENEILINKEKILNAIIRIMDLK